MCTANTYSIEATMCENIHSFTLQRAHMLTYGVDGIPKYRKAYIYIYVGQHFNIQCDNFSVHNVQY